ncbi:MAG: hypothetical protein GY705_01670 [Bacteroidetes bacterium]|nr:hypothetical protein [Bacteroidota bacterium]
MIVLPPKGEAFEVTYLDPGYYVKESATLPLDTGSIAFDSDHNLYTVDRNDFSHTELPNTIDILKYYSATNYSAYSVYYTYTGEAISGLEFDNSGNLYIAEVKHKDGYSDVGRIAKLDSSINVTTIVELTEFRPTGITVDSNGKFYFPGRLQSDKDEGDIHVYDQNNDTLEILVPDFAGTAIAIDGSGNIYCCKRVPINEKISWQIHKFDKISYESSIFAITDESVNELTFDFERNDLYLLEYASPSPEMITISSGVTFPWSMFLPAMKNNSINLGE